MIHIFTSNIITTENDAFWTMNEDLVSSKKPLPVLILSVPLSAADRTQLGRMMSACQLSDADYNLIELEPGRKCAWHHLYHALHPKHVILLGIENNRLAISSCFMPHQVNRFYDCSFIPTLSLPELEEYPDIKKHLWNYGLRPVFVEKAYG